MLKSVLGKSSARFFCLQTILVTWPRELMGNVSQLADNVDFIYIFPTNEFEIESETQVNPEKKGRAINSFCNSSNGFSAF